MAKDLLANNAGHLFWWRRSHAVRKGGAIPINFLVNVHINFFVNEHNYYAYDCNWYADVQNYYAFVYNYYAFVYNCYSHVLL